MAASKFRRKTRRRRRANKLRPLTPEAHAAAAAAVAQARERARGLRRQWRTEDALYRNAAVLEYERRIPLRSGSRTACAKELTTRLRPLDQAHRHPDS